MISLKKLAVCAAITTVATTTAATFRDRWSGYQGGPNLPPPNYGQPNHIRCFKDPYTPVGDLDGLYAIAAEAKFNVNYLTCRGRKPKECTRWRAWRMDNVFVAGNTRSTFSTGDYACYLDQIIEACTVNGRVSGSMWMDKSSTGPDSNWIYIQ